MNSNAIDKIQANTTRNTMRFNITLPTDIGLKIKSKPNRSALIAESLREKFDREEKDKLDSILLTSYAEAVSEDKEVSRDWDATSGDNL